MRNLSYKGVLLVAGLFFAFGFMKAQIYNVVDSDLEITGTSTLHDWEMNSDYSEGYLKGVVQNSNLKSIQEMRVQMKVTNLKSGKDAMDKVAYDAMKNDRFKNVDFELISATKKNENWVLHGYFTFAGARKEVKLNVAGNVIGKTITLIGSYTFKLTDFGIEPPTAMFGTIKTGDDVSLNFNIKFK